MSKTSSCSVFIFISHSLRKSFTSISYLFDYFPELITTFLIIFLCLFQSPPKIFLLPISQQFLPSYTSVYNRIGSFLFCWPSIVYNTVSFLSQLFFTSSVHHGVLYFLSLHVTSPHTSFADPTIALLNSYRSSTFLSVI